MLLAKIFERFANGSPVTVMLRGTLEYALRPELLDQLFQDTARRQYTHKLLFSTLVGLTALVVCRIHPSHNAAYQADPAAVGVSLRALYDKLEHTEPALSAAMVPHVAGRLIPVLQGLQAGATPRLEGYRLRILDGNPLAATEHRLKESRDLRAGPRPGLALVAYDPQWGMITDVIPCEDGHAQERALLGEVLPLVRPKDVWVAIVTSARRTSCLGSPGVTASSSSASMRRRCGGGASGSGAPAGAARRARSMRKR